MAYPLITPATIKQEPPLGCEELQSVFIKTEFDTCIEPENGPGQIKEEPQSTQETKGSVFPAVVKEETEPYYHLHPSSINETKVFDGDTDLQHKTGIKSEDINIKEVISEKRERHVFNEVSESKDLCYEKNDTENLKGKNKNYSHICDVCNKAFKSEFLLNAHKITHVATFPDCPYLCEFCGKSFIHESKLDQHMTTHTSERPFTCIKCNKSFALKSYLKQHMRSHADVLPVFCRICNKSYSYKSTLARHVMRAHKDKSVIS